MTLLTTATLYISAALFEILGCFAFWIWVRHAKSAFWLIPGVVCLVVFAFLLTRIDTAFAGRAFAAYGGVYVCSSLVCLWVLEGTRPDKWDFVGGGVCLLGVVIILFGPRALSE
jgi:small multidrug resistance family-3 protein